MKNEDDARFRCREDAVEFMDLMLKHKMFHRAKKITVPDKKKKGKDNKKDKKGKFECYQFYVNRK